MQTKKEWSVQSIRPDGSPVSWGVKPNGDPLVWKKLNRLSRVAEFVQEERIEHGRIVYIKPPLREDELRFVNGLIVG